MLGIQLRKSSEKDYSFYNRILPRKPPSIYEPQLTVH